MAEVKTELLFKMQADLAEIQEVGVTFRGTRPDCLRQGRDL
jgi:hypothetical protein